MVTAVIGGTVVLIGVITVFTPGPAIIIIPLGIAILALEFEWARRLLRRVRQTAVQHLGGEVKFERKMRRQQRLARLGTSDDRWHVRMWNRTKLRAVKLLRKDHSTPTEASTQDAHPSGNTEMPGCSERSSEPAP